MRGHFGRSALTFSPAFFRFVFFLLFFWARVHVAIRAEVKITVSGRRNILRRGGLSRISVNMCACICNKGTKL